MFGIKKYEKFLFGRPFILATDHKPLQAIFNFKKGLPSCTTARLQRYAIRLSIFNFKVEYRPGPSNSNADALSRAPVDSAPEEDEAQLFSLHCLSSLPLNSKTIAKETLRDPVLSVVSTHIQNGWPSDRPSQVDVIPFWRKQSELSITDEITMWGRRAVIPHIACAAILEELHKTHQGIVKMKALARISPGLDSDIETLTKSCLSCQLTAFST